jgi:hypothetical protein
LVRRRRKESTTMEHRFDALARTMAGRRRVLRGLGTALASAFAFGGIDRAAAYGGSSNNGQHRGQVCVPTGGACSTGTFCCNNDVCVVPSGSFTGVCTDPHG